MFHVERQGAIDIIAGAAALNHETAESLSTAVDQCITTGQPMIVFDMSGIPLIDSRGLETLLDLQESLEDMCGLLKLAAPTSLCDDALRVTGVGSRFEIHDDVRSAVGSFLR